MKKEIKDGLKILKNDIKVYKKDNKFYTEKEGKLEQTPEAFLAQYHHALSQKLGIKRRTLQAINTAKNNILNIKLQMSEPLQMVNDNIKQFNPHIEDAYKMAGNPMEDKAFGDKPVKKIDYKKSKKEILKEIGKIDKLIKTEIEKLKETIKETLEE
ncbi:MAG: hypothetical protein DRP46_14225 [Candidatus Zixiibacteriota bacterium]|nr:MAG: hypothetical protein DRP46_14225 [candidate division Zixibacteria bacterium]